MRWMQTLLGLAAVAGLAHGGPIKLSAESIDGVYLEASGFSVFQGGTLDSADSFSKTPAVSIVEVGRTSGVSAGGGGPFGAFVDLSRGLLGTFAGGPAGSLDPSFAESGDAELWMNLTFTGTGGAEFDFHLTGNAGADVNGGAGSGMSVSEGGYHFSNGAVDPFITFPGQFLSVGRCVGNFGCATPFDGKPFDLVLDLAIDPMHNQFQVVFQVHSGATGPAFSDLANTAAISLTLSPGVGVDLSQGFLSVAQTPEPNYFGASSGVPEPGTAALVGIAFLTLPLVRRKRDRHRREDSDPTVS